MNKNIFLMVLAAIVVAGLIFWWVRKSGESKPKQTSTPSNTVTSTNTNTATSTTTSTIVDAETERTGR